MCHSGLCNRMKEYQKQVKKKSFALDVFWKTDEGEGSTSNGKCGRRVLQGVCAIDPVDLSNWHRI